MATKGNDIIVYKAGTAIASARSCTITHQCSTLEIASNTSADTREFIEGKKSWEITVSYLVFGDFKDSMNMVGTEYRLTFGYRDESTTTYGDAICSECKITGTRGNIAQGSFRFVGDGPLQEG